VSGCSIAQVAQVQIVMGFLLAGWW